MKRLEALLATATAFLMVTAGAVWQFGPYGLLGAGAVALVVLTFVNPMDMKPSKKE